MKEPAPPRFSGLLPTPFRIAERADGPGELLIILPGFGVSVSQIEVDRLLWNFSPRYGCIVTHAAVNYRTSHDFLLWQYAQLLRHLHESRPLSGRPINLLGISLGGTTAVQLLSQLLDDDKLYPCFRKIVTLVSAVSQSDFTPRWQNILRLIRELRGKEQSQGEVQRIVRGTVLRVVARAIKKNVQRSCLEADSCDEIIASFTHFAEAYSPDTPALPLGILPGVEIVSVGLELDGMVAESRAHRYAAAGRHITLPGEHNPGFYARAKEQYDQLILTELG